MSNERLKDDVLVAVTTEAGSEFQQFIARFEKKCL